jgi:hypothetical protein
VIGKTALTNLERFNNSGIISMVVVSLSPLIIFPSI